MNTEFVARALGRLAPSGAARSLEFSRVGSDSILLTVGAMLITFFLAAQGPAIPWCLGLLLSDLAEPAALARPLAGGLRALAAVYLVLELLRQLCRRDGLAEAHFRWPRRAVQHLRSHLRWLLPLLLPMVFITALLVEVARGAESVAAASGHLSGAAGGEAAPASAAPSASAMISSSPGCVLAAIHTGRAPSADLSVATASGVAWSGGESNLRFPVTTTFGAPSALKRSPSRALWARQSVTRENIAATTER